MDRLGGGGVDLAMLDARARADALDVAAARVTFCSSATTTKSRCCNAPLTT
jgi:hypothetical protein